MSGIGIEALRKTGRPEPFARPTSTSHPPKDAVRHRPTGRNSAEFAGAITQLDEALKRKIRDLRHHRRRIAELDVGERLFLPAAIIDILDRLRALGVSKRMVQIERDVRILVAALSPRSVPSGWTRRTRLLPTPSSCASTPPSLPPAFALRAADQDN
jgi:hypothetical protein